MQKHLHHIGVVYKDISAYAEKIKKLYSIEFEVEEHSIPVNTVIQELKDPMKIKIIHARIGNTEIEIFEPQDDKSIYADYLKKTPEGGVHHVGFLVDDFENHKKEWDASGLKRILTSNPPMKFAYYDTTELFGYVTEILEIEGLD